MLVNFLCISALTLDIRLNGTVNDKSTSISPDVKSTLLAVLLLALHKFNVNFAFQDIGRDSKYFDGSLNGFTPIGVSESPIMCDRIPNIVFININTKISFLLGTLYSNCI
jgi:hypothetical protein